MTTAAECAYVAPTVSLAATWTTLSGLGNYTLMNNVIQAAGALANLGTGAAQNTYIPAQYSAWQAAVQAAVQMALATGDNDDAQVLNKAVQILGNLAAGQ